MKRIFLSWALVLLAMPLLPAADDEKTSLHLVARRALDVETINAYLQAGEKSRAALVALKAELAGLHGKKEKNWPADARERYEAAEKADERAADVSWYGVNLQPDLDDSLRDLTEAVADKKTLGVAAGREDADLVVEILGRNRGRFGGQLGNSTARAARSAARGAGLQVPLVLGDAVADPADLFGGHAPGGGGRGCRRLFDVAHGRRFDGRNRFHGLGGGGALLPSRHPWPPFLGRQYT